MLQGNPVIFTDCRENPVITIGFPYNLWGIGKLLYGRTIIRKCEGKKIDVLSYSCWLDWMNVQQFHVLIFIIFLLDSSQLLNWVNVCTSILEDGCNQMILS